MTDHLDTHSKTTPKKIRILIDDLQFSSPPVPVCSSPTATAATAPAALVSASASPSVVVCVPRPKRLDGRMITPESNSDNFPAITGLDLSVLALSIVKQGESDLPGLTDTVVPKRLGPKRATKIRRFFGLDKKDDVRKFVIRRTVTKEGKKEYTKAPKIQRLVTPQRLQHKRQRVAIKRRRAEAAREAAYVPSP